MRMLVAVKMRQGNSARLDLADLRFHFPLDFFRRNLLADCCQSKLLEAIAETLRIFRLRIFCE